MILELILTPIFLLVKGLISLMPASQNVGVSIVGFFDLLRIGLYFFSATTFKIIIGNIVFWAGVQFTWAIIEWIYRKIPGVT